MPRLSPSALDRIPADRTTRIGRRSPDATIGVVHLGIGAFHRAHQATFIEDAMEVEGTDRWGICGVTQRSSEVLEQLAPQSGLYTVLERDAEQVSARVVAAVHEVVSAREDAAGLRSRLADSAVAVVTMTVTEKGYRRDPDGRLDRRDPLVAADLAGSEPGSAIGQLVRGMQARRLGDGAPLTVISCDNLVGNGPVVRALVRDFCAALPGAEGEPLWEWVEANVRFPSSMVDRIVPATTAADREQGRQLLGVWDAGLVVAEPFRQWVIEDHFAGPVPGWHRVGAQLTGDVAPFEAAKLRLLNATHSLLAYTGALAGHTTIAEAIRDERLADHAARLMSEDALPTLARVDGLDLEDYQRSVLQRFGNAALRHRTTQVAMDGSQKLPVRLLGTVRDRLRAGGEPRWAALAVAAWMVYVARARDVLGRPLPVEDPIAARLHAAAAGPDSGLVRRMLAVREVFDAELAESHVLTSLLGEHTERLLSQVA